MTRDHLITCLRVVLCAVLLCAVGTCVVYGAWWLALLPLALFMPTFGTSCTIFSDDFSTDQIATAYHTSSGSWAVSAGVLTCTSASALLRCETAASVSATGSVVSATLTMATTSDKGRLILGYTDDSNYWFVETQPGATNGTLRIFQKASGTDTQKGGTLGVSGLTAGTAVTICFAIDATTALVSYTRGAVTNSIATTASVTMASTKPGMGTGSGSSSVVFDNFAFAQHPKDNNTCNTCAITCGGCNTGTAPAEVTISFSGVTNGSCASCTGLNSTFVLPFDSGTAGTNCAYRLDIPSATGCQVNFISYAAGPVSSAEAIEVTLASTIFDGIWKRSGVTFPIDCSTGYQSIAYSSGSGAICGTASSTATRQF